MFLTRDISGCCGSSALIWMMWAFMKCQRYYSNVCKHWRQATPLHKPSIRFFVWHNHCSLGEPTHIRMSQELSRHDRLASTAPGKYLQKRYRIFLQCSTILEKPNMGVCLRYQPGASSGGSEWCLPILCFIGISCWELLKERLSQSKEEIKTSPFFPLSLLLWPLCDFSECNM